MVTDSNKASVQLIAGLTTFRAFAFLAVFFFHAGWFEAGYLGVQAFFVLSGFLLTPILLNMRARLDTRSLFTRFYGRRALRIFPLYYMYLAAALVFALVLKLTGHYDETQSVVRFVDQLPWALTYLYDFFHASSLYQHTPFLSHFWSLAVEEQFYLVWPFLIAFVPKTKLKPMLAVLILAGPLLRWGTILLVSSGQVGFLGDDADLAVYVLPFSHIDAFATGACFACFARSIPERHVWLILVTVIGGAFCYQYVTHGEIVWSSLGFEPFMSHKSVFGYTVLNLLFSLILVQVRAGRFLPRLFELKSLKYLGTISYGLYVFHFPVLWATGRFCSGVPLVLLSLLATILLSAGSYELVERRLIGMKDRLFPTPAARKPLGVSGPDA